MTNQHFENLEIAAMVLMTSVLVVSLMMKRPIKPWALTAATITLMVHELTNGFGLMDCAALVLGTATLACVLYQAEGHWARWFKSELVLLWFKLNPFARFGCRTYSWSDGTQTRMYGAFNSQDACERWMHFRRGVANNIRSHRCTYREYADAKRFKANDLHHPKPKRAGAANKKEDAAVTEGAHLKS